MAGRHRLGLGRISKPDTPLVRSSYTYRYADNAVEAGADLSRSVDDALADTGLFEEFDVTGRELRVAPLEHRGAT